MGKIANALEKYKRERSIATERLAIGSPGSALEESPNVLPIYDRNGQNRISQKLFVAAAPESVDAENFRVLRSQIIFPRNGKRPRTIMVASALPGEGKTFVAANLAVSIALGIDEHVLLIDGDLRKPNLEEMLGYYNRNGLHDYLSCGKQLKDLLVRTRVEKLSLLPAGGPCENPSELLASQLMRELLEEVQARYQDRYIIIDVPPSEITSETNILARYVDGVVLVVMNQRSPREAIQRTVENVGREKILGIVFNGYRQSHKTYGRYYQSYYSPKKK